MTTKDDEDKLLRSVVPQNANSIRIARQRAEEALQASEQLFRSIFENAQIGISFFKCQNPSPPLDGALYSPVISKNM